MLSPGTIIADRYVIVRLVGEGGMGSVYEAKHINIGKRVAVKLLSKELSADSEAIERFQQEAQIAGSIGHLNICEVMDFGVTDDGCPFLVMEYLQGESLAGILKREKRLPVDIVLGILSQVLDALVEVHGKDIVHRDLKPENIFITNIKGHGLVVKLLDFGISKVVRPGADSFRLTKTGTMVGTPYYMSPEQVRGSRNVDHRTDIYSCGVILYEMITGRVPFGGTSFNEILAMILESPLPDPRKIMPDLKTEVAKLIERSMAKDPAKRFESAEKFKETINKIRVEIGDGKAAGIPSTKMASMVSAPTAMLQAPRGIKIAVISGILLFLVAIIAGTVIIISHSFKSEKAGDKTSTLVESKLKPGKAAPSNSSASPLTQPVAEKPKIMITLLKTPPGVRVTFGNRTTDGKVLEVEKSQQPIKLIVSAEGYKSKEIKIIPSDDMTLNGKLIPVTTESTGKGKAKKAPEKSKPSVEPEKQEPKKKMKQIWDNYPSK